MDCIFNRTLSTFTTRLAGREQTVATVVVESHTFDLMPEAFVSFNDYPVAVPVEAAHKQMEALRRAGYACTLRREALVCDDADHYDLEDEQVLDEDCSVCGASCHC